MTARGLLAGTLLVSLLGPARAQPGVDTRAAERRTRVYAELLGNAGGGSLNVERALGGTVLGSPAADARVSVRVGVGFMPGLETTVDAVAVPVMLSLTPRGRRGVEVGVGLVFRHETAGRTVYRDGGYVDLPAQFTDPFYTATVGYRWISARGTLVRVGLTPLVRGRPEGYDRISGGIPWLGASVGHAF